MKVRIKFSKHGNLIYIGHLDLMRYFQKCMRRADIPIKYSEGFSPHQIMSFASPLGIGMESDAEYCDIELVDGAEISKEEALDRLNGIAVEGIEFLDWKVLPDAAKKSMSILTSADYDIVGEGFDLSRIPEDMKKLIYSIEETDTGLKLKVAQGSTANLKPEDVIIAALGLSREAGAVTASGINESAGSNESTGSDSKLRARAVCRIIRKEMYGPDGLTL